MIKRNKNRNFERIEHCLTNLWWTTMALFSWVKYNILNCKYQIPKKLLMNSKPYWHSMKESKCLNSFIMVFGSKCKLPTCLTNIIDISFHAYFCVLIKEIIRSRIIRQKESVGHSPRTIFIIEWWKFYLIETLKIVNFKMHLLHLNRNCQSQGQSSICYYDICIFHAIL